MAASSYATFEFYTGTYLGAAIPESSFPRLALRASAVVDRLTFNRAAAIVEAGDEEQTILAIQNATCAIAEEIQTEELNGNIDGLTSERIGNSSVTYGANAKATMTNEQRQMNSALLYLGSTGLMYPGIRRSD